MAVNCILPFGAEDAEEGETVTEAVVPPFGDAGLPWSRNTMGRWCASVEIARVPSTPVPAEATNLTEKLARCRGERVNGVASPTMLKPAPLMLVWLICKLVVPTLVTVTVWELAAPAGALSDRLLGVTES